MTFIHQWQRTADAVLSVLIAEEIVSNGKRERYDTAIYDIGLSDSHFPTQGHLLTPQMQLWRAITSLRQQGKPVHQTTILSDPYGAGISAEWLALLITQYSEALDGKVFRANADALKAFGEKHLIIRALEFARNDLETGKDLDVIVNSLMGTFANRGATTIEDETADAQPFFDLFDCPPEPRILSHIKPIDVWTGGGIGLGEVIGIVAPEKSRKTSLALNWALNFARQGASVSVFMLESTIDSIKARLVSMFAIQWLLERDLYDKADKNNYPMYSGLSGRNLLKSRNGYKRWDPIRVQAIEHGLSEFRKLATVIRFYDRSFRSGNLSDLQSVERVLMYDKRKYGTQMVILDHLQRITGKRQNIFELMSGAVNMLEEHARKYQTSMILLSQLNETTKAQGADAVVVGSKGDGGALGAAVDYLLKVTYSHTENMPMGYLLLNMFLSREGVGGKDVKENVLIEPVSGLIPAGDLASKYTRFSDF